MLSFPEMRVRESKVESAYEATYEWVCSSDEYTLWKSCCQGRLLIKGKAGCGKSTLMKRLLAHELSQRDPESNTVVCRFFFNGRGVPVEKSTEGMLRTLLHQFLAHNPATYDYLAPWHLEMQEARKLHKTLDWTEESLKKMLKKAAQVPAQHAVIFIDALDEGEGFLPSAMFAFLEDLFAPLSAGSFDSICICLSSRPENFVNNKTNWATIDLGQKNSADIETYTKLSLSDAAEQCAKYEAMVPELTNDIAKKSNGVFLWVKLVVSQLL
jgi:GTPase SAR1 family protein